MKKFSVIALAFGLAACGAAPEESAAQMAYIQSQMPKGCTLHYAGEVLPEGAHYSSRIFYTVCGGVATISETHEVRTGKTTHSENTITISR